MTTPEPARKNRGSRQLRLGSGTNSKLDRALLDLVVVPRRSRDQTRPPAGRFYNSEVDTAKEMMERWRVYLFSMSPSEVVEGSRLDFYPLFPP
jgi:hypothetical protein